MKRHTAIIVIALVGLVFTGVNHAMSILDIKLSLSASWKERFQDVNKLNNYAKAQPVELSNVKIESERIDGAVINGGLFKSTDWKKVSARKSNMTKVVFRDGALENVDFNDSTLTDVVFEDVTLEEVRFVNATLVNVKFIHCTLNGVNIDQTRMSSIEISRSRVINTSLSDGQLMAVVKNSILTRKTSLTDLQPPSSLTFEKSELDDVDLSRSVLDELKLNDIKSRKSGFDTGSIKKVNITGGDISFGFTEAKIEEIKIHDLGKVGLAFQDGYIKSMHFSNCLETFNINLFHATVGTIDVEDCTLNNFAPVQATLESLRVKNAKIINSDFQDMKAKTVVFDNVTLDGQLNFTGAHVNEVKTNNLTKQHGLKLITDGSNVHL